MTRNFIILMILVFLSSCEKNLDENNLDLKLYGDALEDIGYSISKTDNGFYLGGQFTEVTRENGNYIDAKSSRKKMAIVKTDLNGSVLWKKSFPSDTLTAAGSKVITLSDGSVISTGYIVDPLTKQKDIYVVKVSSDGQGIVERIFNSEGTSVTGNSNDGNQAGIDILQASDNGFMLLGSTDIARLQSSDSTGNIKGNTDIYLLKLDANLNAAGYPQVIGNPGNDLGAAIKQDGSNGYIILGTTNRSWPGQSLNNLMLIKVTLNGALSQVRILGTTDDEYASDIEVLSDGYLVAGTIGADGTTQQIYLTKVPQNILGAQLFTNKKLTLTSSQANSFAIKAISRYGTNSFVVGGQAGTGASAKMLIYVADADGNLIQGKELVTVSSGSQVAYDVITDENNNIIAVGKNSYENNSLISFYRFRF